MFQRFMDISISYSGIQLLWLSCANGHVAFCAPSIRFIIFAATRLVVLVMSLVLVHP